MKTIITLILACSVFITTAQPLTLKFRPDSVIYLYETTGIGSARPLYAGMLQNTALLNEGATPLVISGGELRLLVKGNVIALNKISRSTIKNAAQQFNMLQQMGVLDLYDFQLQTRQYLPDATFSPTDTLATGNVIIVTHLVFMTDELPDEAEVIFYAATPNGKQVVTKKRLKVVNYSSKNKYILPLKGNWTTAAAPSLVSHHRWASVQEFAYDFIQVGENNLTYKNDGQHLTDYYCYGKPIYAISAGKVVSVLTDQEESEALLKKPDEDPQVYLQRLMASQQSLLMKGFDKVLGNHAIIEHENGEYSFYVHMKKGSVKVKTGDRVAQGTEIGAVGNSGNTTEPHLHFHISDRPDFVNSRSLPVRFSNIELIPDDNGKLTHIHSGQIIKSK